MPNIYPVKIATAKGEQSSYQSAEEALLNSGTIELRFT
jgi:hypothetical protein